MNNDNIVEMNILVGKSTIYVTSLLFDTTDIFTWS